MNAGWLLLRSIEQKKELELKKRIETETTKTMLKDKFKQIAKDEKIIDKNDFWLIKNNPLTKIGVFPYLGKQISAELEPDTIYQVLRPEEELTKPETLKSLELIPLVDEHTMLGDNIVLSNNYKEDMYMATYCVVREEYWDLDSLEEIEKQLHLISPIERIMFYILKEGIKVCNFYTGFGLGWYHTSIPCNRKTFSFNSIEFENYALAKNKFNQIRDNVFISVLQDYSDETLFIEHNEPLTQEKISYLIDFQEEYLSTEEKFIDFYMQVVLIAGLNNKDSFFARYCEGFDK